MKDYDIIAIGTGSAMTIVSDLMEQVPDIRIAVVESGPVGGICLTRGCIPSKLILYPAELVETIRQAGEFGIRARIESIDFEHIMRSMRETIGEDSRQIREGILSTPNIDLYQVKGEFIGDYTLKVGDGVIRGRTILICSGSRPLIPDIPGLGEAGYLTSTSFLRLTRLPRSVAVIGGGYIAAEYGHFLASMGSRVTIIGRNPQFVPREEPEVSALLMKHLSERMVIHTGMDIRSVAVSDDMKRITCAPGGEGRGGNEPELVVEAEEILVATGRASYSPILKPWKTGVETDPHGWIKVDEKMQTSKADIWAFGDAIGGYMFKHTANLEARVAFYNAFTDHEITMDYHAVPRAIFTSPEVASVGMTEAEARKHHRVLIGTCLYENTAKGQAMHARDHFVKVIVERDSDRILGAHIIGPQASVLIQEIITLMYTPTGSWIPIRDGMHIHPALSEVVERAFMNLFDPDAHHHHGHGHQDHDHDHDQDQDQDQDHGGGLHGRQDPHQGHDHDHDPDHRDGRHSLSMSPASGQERPAKP